MTVIFSDTFTEASNTLLEDHTPDTGDSWTRLWVSGGGQSFQVVSTGAGIRSSANAGNQGFIYTADVTYLSANYEVQLTFVTTFNTATPLYILARVADQENMYAMRIVSGTDGGQLYKKVSGSWSTLGTAVTIADGSVVVLSVNGTAIKVFDDTVEVIGVTDGDLSAAGKAGLAHGGEAELVDALDDIRAVVMCDTFSVTDLGAGVAGQPMMLRATTVPGMRQWQPR